jgi:hypothetical protein
MRVWRVIACGVAVLAFTLAAIGPDGVLLPGTIPERGLHVDRMAFFWIGVALILVAAWARGS